MIKSIYDDIFKKCIKCMILMYEIVCHHLLKGQLTGVLKAI